MSCVFQSSVALAFVWLQKQFINNFVFHPWTCAADFNNNINKVTVHLLARVLLMPLTAHLTISKIGF